MIPHPVHLRYRGRPSLDLQVLPWYACSECSLSRGWCQCAEVAR
jgi:hypothetical protein